MFCNYTTGDWSAPSAMVEGVALRYGMLLKQWARRELRRVFNIKDMSIGRTPPYLLGIEERLKSLLLDYGSIGVLAA